MTCLGYQDDSDLIFRPCCWSTSHRLPDRWSSEKSSTQDLSFIWDPVNLVQATDAELEESALAAFVYHYCLVPKRSSIENLQTVLPHIGISSNLARAAKIGALANIGTRLGRPSLVQKAQILYSGMLPSFRTMVATMSSNAELLMTAVLLGLYEVCITFMSAELSDSG